jgi:hypothetical protein
MNELRAKQGDSLLDDLTRRVTHGRHCPCSSCAREDWTNPQLGPCGMHGSACPPVYTPVSHAECRLRAMLSTLKDQVSSALAHKAKMLAALDESPAWALAEDREWIAEAVVEADQMKRDAENRLAQGLAIAERTLREVPGV